jgi:hypothetical protein
MRRKVYTKDESKKKKKKKKRFQKNTMIKEIKKINMTKDKLKKKTAHEKLDQRKDGSLGTTVQKGQKVGPRWEGARRIHR